MNERDEKLKAFVGAVRLTRQMLEADVRRMRKGMAAQDKGANKDYWIGGLTATRYAIDLLTLDLMKVNRFKS